jgi:predicted DNA-binding transcriptional regulator AlpA
MTPYLSLTEAADRLLVSPEWFTANVAIEVPRPIVLNGETSWLAADVDDWKTRRDAARDVALDELAVLDQERWRINPWNGQRMPTYCHLHPAQFDGFFYRTANASTLI